MAVTEREFRDGISQSPWTEIKEEFEAGRFGAELDLAEAQGLHPMR
jgi:hypothetical protein